MSSADLRERLDGLMLRDRRRIERRLAGRPDLARLARDVETAEAKVAARRAAVPTITYPDLPVSQARDELMTALRGHQVVVVAGETGSGKTTQLPKMLLELGRGITGLIGHTQPRRIAARTVAERIAEELDTPLGETVGYKVRFHDQVGDTTLVKLMTDGILLAELQNDTSLWQYDTLILDEAHERSLNVDFLLGYLKQLLPRRPDLKLVITSATIDPGRFAAHFDDAPVVEVSGRTYPVEVRYRPPRDDSDPVQAIADAVDELERESPGDVLVFLSGEREIRDTAEVLRGRVGERTEVLPLYGRLSIAEQHKVFTAHTGRRVVLATNVAETSLTVPGIRYVVDPGTARISRYSARTKVQRLPIEPISQASARQRAGRCGRVADGICIRLYAEDDFEKRPEYTDPEILRTNLASVILQMTAIGLGDVAAFPFVDPPDRRNIKDGLDLLHELGALDNRRRLTPIGRQLAALPIDPRLARMVVEADRQGALREVLVIAAALSIQDPRERPLDKQQQADELHKRFADPTSDFLTYLNLWNHISEQQKALSSSAFRRLCRTEFLNWLRIREWQDLHSQLRRVARSLELSLNSGYPGPDAVHQSVLAGLLSHVGLRDSEKREYAGARGARFAVVPSSALYKKQPTWVVAAELVETNRMWGRVCARIAPEWAEELGAHLVTRVYSEPHWENKQGAVIGYERVTLYGVPLVARRKVSYARIDPELSRELFLRHALVEGDWETHHAFFADNLRLLEDVEELEHRARRRGIVVDDQTLFDFYDVRIPADVVSGAHFDAWWKTARAEKPDLLTFSMAMLVQESAAVDPGDYPDAWQQGDVRLALTYQFEPGTEADGVTVHIPVRVLGAVMSYGFDWQVPGLRHDLIVALLKSLPKPLRVRLVPAPDTAAALLAVLEPRQEPLLDALEQELLRLRGVDVRRDDWQLDRVPEHLRMTFRIEDERGRTLAEGSDLTDLREQLAPKVQGALSSAAGGLERTGLTAWADVPRSVAAGPGVTGYPALVDEGESVAFRVLGSGQEQAAAMWAGVRRLLLLSIPSPVKAIAGRLSNASKLALTTNPHGNVVALLDDSVVAAVDALMRSGGGLPWDAAAYERLRDHVRGGLNETTEQVLRHVEEALTLWASLTPQVAGISAAQVDMREQLTRLVRPGFVTATGLDRLPDLVRYLTAIEARLSKLPRDADRDRREMATVHAVQEEVDALLRTRPDDPRAREICWLVEELRVSLFAQGMRTRQPVSEKRIYKAIDALL
ncbi:MAG: ATP-dependent RNA helicase HrpA [Frankiaceae bacterium]|nr:ATP-dependent RNA helicase HrpA [Frankiaceae bacterium]